MKWLQAFKSKRPQHKYAINAEMLGDDDEFAWSNLGYWQHLDESYPQACRQLALNLATAVDLNSKDVLLDLGCGKGASLLLWRDFFKVQHIEAVELQAESVDKIKNKIKQIQAVRQGCFLNLNQPSFKFKFDVALCIDAAYHSDLNSFISSVNTVLNSKARIGFHHLMLTEKFERLNPVKKLKLAALLKCADVNLANLLNQQQMQRQLEEQGFQSIEIKNLTEAVLSGFSNYMDKHKNSETFQSNASPFDRLKIHCTAKLCKKLYADGLVDYVQVSAKKIN